LYVYIDRGEYPVQVTIQVTMAELNKNANSIINRAYSSGESVTILKHGKPIARILPINDRSSVEDALSYLSKVEPVDVQDSIDSIIRKGRQYGI
jgi:prevent-host-death family protein